MIKRRGWVKCLFFGTTLLTTLLLPIPASAQRQGDPQPQTPPSEQPVQKPKEADPASPTQPQPAQTRADDGSSKNQSQEEATTPKNDRLFGVLPNYLTVENAAKVPPLTSGGKFKLVAKNAFDPVIFPFIGFIALVNQGQDSDPGFGQGASGFGKRYGASFGDSTIGSFMTGAIFPSLLKQDPRYYQLVRGGFRRRLVYSITRIVITRTDSGRNQFNGSELAGNFVAAGISNAYHPASDRSFKNTLSGWGNDTGWDMMANIAQEFWPDIHVWLKKKFASGKHP
jgi:hypothetical protein